MAFAIGTAIVNLARTQNRDVENIIIFHDGISLSDQSVITTFADVEFIEYEAAFLTAAAKRSRFIDHFSPMVFSKYECLKLLDRYSKVLWLDYDIHVLKDISELLQGPDTPFSSLPSGRPVSGSFTRPISGFNMEIAGMSSGTFVISRSIGDFTAIHQFCEEQTLQNARRLKMPEQAIFDLAFQEFGVEPSFIDPEKYALHPEKWNGDPYPSILHCYGRRKFWSGLEFRPWRSNYKIWLERGGSAAPPELSRPKRWLNRSRKVFNRHRNPFR